MSDPDVDTLLAQARMPETAEPHVDDGRLVAYARGELAEAEAEPLEAHLAGSEPCRQLLSALSEPVPEDLRKWAEDRVAEAASPERGRARWLAPVGGVLAAAVAAVFVVIAVGSGSGSDLSVPAYALEGPFGGIAAVRSGQAEAEAPTFAAGTRIEAVLRPDDAVEPDARPEVVVYVQGPTQTLERVDASYLAPTAAGGFVFEAPAEAVLGPKPGRYIVHFVLVADAEDWPERLAGRAALRSRDRARLLTLEANFIER